MSYQVHNFQTGEIIEAAPINEMDEQIRKNSEEKIDVSMIGVASGVAGLDNSGKVPLSQLPDSESDIIEGYYYNNKFYKDSSHTTEIAAERRKIYIDLPTNETYRWNGESYVVTSSDTSGKADKVQNATEGNFAGLDANGNLTDSGKSTEDFAGAIYKTIDAPASIITIEDGADDLPVKELNVGIEPVQDLHGYDHPWPAGGGKNLLKVTTETQTVSGVTFTVNSDGTIVANGTAIEDIALSISSRSTNLIPSNKYILNGCPAGGSTSTYALVFWQANYGEKYDTGSGITTDSYSIDRNYIIQIIVKAGVSVNNLLFKPMLRLSSVSDATFAPYSNICPISGWTGAKIERMPQIIPLRTDAATEYSDKGVMYKIIRGNMVKIVGTASGGTSYSGTIGGMNYVVPSGDWIVKLAIIGDATNVIVMTQFNGENIALEQANNHQRAITGDGAKKLSWYALAANGTSVNAIIAVCICKASSDIDQISFTFPSEAGTVYGGTLDVVSGKLVVDRTGLIDLSTLNWDTQKSYGDFKLYTIRNEAWTWNKETDAVVANALQYVVYSNGYYSPTAETVLNFADKTITIVDTRRLYAWSTKTTVAEFKQYLSDIGAVASIRRNKNTVLEYQLSVPQVRTLLGLNHIWADTGDITELIYSVNTDTAMALYEKADKVANATAGNFAALDAEGNLTDSGKKPGDFLTEHQDISGKADKVSGATNGNFAGLDANGNLTDSGKKPSDFLTQHQDISGKVDKNQGAANAGKALGINSEGQVVPVPFSGEDFTGATSTSAGAHGYVPAPAAGDQKKVLMGDGTWDNAPGAKIYTRTITITNTSGVYSQTYTDENISQDMKAVTLEVLNPDVYGDKIKVQCFDGSFEVSCPSITGSDTAKISFMKVCEDPTAITSTEFTILNNRLLQVENVEVNYDVVIPVNAWTLDSGEYVYTWSNSTLNENTSVSIEFLNDDTDVDYIETEKITGGVKFYSKWLPDNTIRVNTRVCYARDYQIVDISGDTVSTDVVSGASNVNEALDILQDNISDSVSQTQDGLAIVANGNTHAAISSGQFVYVKNHDTLAEGLYKATAAIEQNGALSTSNLIADGSGGLNDLQSQATNLQSQITSLSSKFSTIEDHQITRIGNYIVERSAFKARRIGQVVQIYSYVNVTTQVPSGTDFADTGFSNAEGTLLAIEEGGAKATVVTCTNGKLHPNANLQTGYYNFVGSMLSPR